MVCKYGTVGLQVGYEIGLVFGTGKRVPVRGKQAFRQVSSTNLQFGKCVHLKIDRGSLSSFHFYCNMQNITKRKVMS